MNDRRSRLKKLTNEDAEKTFKSIEETVGYLESLDPLTKTNFVTFLQTPNARENLSRCPDDRMREMGTLILDLNILEE